MIEQANLTTDMNYLARPLLPAAFLFLAFVYLPCCGHPDPFDLSPSSDQLASLEDSNDTMMRGVRSGSDNYNLGEKYESSWHSFRRVCYFRMDPKTKMEVQDIDGNLCTHIIFAFCRIDPNGMIVYGAESDDKYMRAIPWLKQRYPHLKVLVSLYNEKQFNGFGQLTEGGEPTRKRFAQQALEFIKEYQLDGLDLDWEFPNFPRLPLNKGREREREALTAIVGELRTQIALSSQPHILLTIASAGQDMVIKASYELDKLAPLVDWFNLMTYDYYLFKSYTPLTGPNSPIHSIQKKTPIMKNLSIEWSVNRYIKLGVPKDKIVMGVPTYARGFKLVSGCCRLSTKPKALKLAYGSKGGKVADYYDLDEVCTILEHPKTSVSFDEVARVPYLVAPDSTTWISYENEQSVREKIDFAIDMGLGGYMTWNLNSDNHKRECKSMPFLPRMILHGAMLHQAFKRLTGLELSET